ncbi:TonB-linked SusC/RagA family outer membrane protein [Mucilaginibacter gracilis]|uniref:TonB-linked SusC/RagA family outer membrane protein n=1 Tax=Mucilaginibacter gracilis TaxID=423350 RepID=A0A495ITQ9_9SPHI|nr:SusC/RagA family TonB-linked outer membrane protein [Mucilaginibacter gracilis]RKR79962.1 TonB-linked SusC/RagA family outer membrane protein [Mucilaginibacter gracilis]
MKVNAIIVIILLFAVSSINASTVTAQTLSEVKVSFGLSQANLQTALTKIESQTDFRFAFRKNEIGSVKAISLSAQTRSVQQVLDELLKGTGLTYKQTNNSIIIFKYEAPKVEKQIATEQIRGTVKDEEGEPLPGVSIKVKGKPSGAISDLNGVFTVQASQNDVLVFSYIGYATIEKTVSGTQAINVTMKTTVGTLDAVVVIGYGTTTKRNNTGSVTSITAKDIGSQPVTDPLAALQGRVAGLDISAVTGYPGSGYNVHLRGENFINGGNDPLYIVDGVPFISTGLSQFDGANGSQSPLSSINPTDIERIDILKDADATAIYGSRGANGVILITTKQGKAGKPEFNFNVYSGISKVNHMVDMLNITDYLALRREAFANDHVTPTIDKAPDLLSWDPNLNQNWQKMLVGKSAGLTEASGSLRGGTEQTNFLISGTVRDEKIVLPGDLGYKRAALNLSLNHQSVDNKFKINASIKYTSDQNNTIATDITQYYNLPPNYPIYDAAGAYYWYGNQQNPLAFLARSSDSQTHTLFGNTSISYMILPGLNIKTTGGFTQMGMKQTQTYPQASYNPATYSGSQAYYGNSDMSSYIIEPQIDYTRKISKGTFNALLGGTWQQSITNGQSVIGSGYASDELLGAVDAAASVSAKTFNYGKYRYTSIFGRVTYNWDEKYIVNGTFRRDGSSRFGPNRRYGNFGAVGAAWLFSNESLIKDKISFLSFGKLRGSFGIVGNDQIGDYGYLDSWGSASFPYGGSSSLYPIRFPNPDFGWEENKKIEGGIDLGFLSDRILLTVNYYRNRSNNQVVNEVLSPQSGFTGFTGNLPALVQNTGWEFELNTVNIQKKNFNWNTSFNITFARTELLEFPDFTKSAYADTYVIGQPLNIVRGYDFTRVNPQTGVPEFRDLNNSGGIDDPDLVTLGSTTPDFYGGIQNSFNYKSFSFNFFFQFVKQNGPGLNYGYLSYPNGILQNSEVSALNRWKQPGDQTNIPGATATAGTATYAAYQNAYRLSSANWVDASFIRLKNVSLKYNFANLVKSLKLKNLSVYVQGQNLFTITKYKGFDPETKGYALPPLSVYTAGVQVSF